MRPQVPGEPLSPLLFVLAEDCVCGILDAAEDRLAARLCPTLLRLCRFNVERQSQISGAHVCHKIVTKDDIVQGINAFRELYGLVPRPRRFLFAETTFFQVALEGILPGWHLDPVLLQTLG